MPITQNPKFKIVIIIFKNMKVFCCQCLVFLPRLCQQNPQNFGFWKKTRSFCQDLHNQFLIFWVEIFCIMPMTHNPKFKIWYYYFKKTRKHAFCCRCLVFLPKLCQQKRTRFWVLKNRSFRTRFAQSMHLHSKPSAQHIQWVMHNHLIQRQSQ
jgi:hypothetical protein